jgi:hypothetical protein
MGKRKMTKEQTMIYNILHRKLKIKQHKPDYKPGLNSDAPERLAVPAPQVTPVMLLLNDMNII